MRTSKLAFGVTIPYLLPSLSISFLFSAIFNCEWKNKWKIIPESINDISSIFFWAQTLGTIGESPTESDFFNTYFFDSKIWLLLNP